MGLADDLIFFPPPRSYDSGLDGLVRLETSSGEVIAARWLRAPDARVTVIFAHGNAEDVGHGVPFQDRYARLGVSVLAFDYPGYGLCGGRPSEEGAYRAADAAYEYLVAREGVAPPTIVAHGRSLGGGVLADLASRRPVGGLVLESTFVSAFRVVTRLPLSPIDQFRTLAKLPRIQSPVLVVHGGRDEVIAPWHGQRLFQAVPEGRRHWLWVERAGHNDLAAVAGVAYWEALAAFFDTVADTPADGD